MSAQLLHAVLPLTLAQELSVPAQIEFTLERVLTPTGAAIALLLLAAAVLAMVLRKVVPVSMGSILFLSTLQLTNLTASNVLLGPFQTLRAMAKSFGLVLLLVTVVFLATVPQANRFRSAGPASLGFLIFQLYYVVQLTIFATDYALKGVLGIITMVLMYLVFGVMFGRRMQDLSSATIAMSTFAWVGLAHVAVNMIQIVVSPGGALVGLRLAGTAGNAQMMGCISTLLMLVNAYLAYELPKSNGLRWVSLTNVGLLGVFVLATGSRTAVMAAGLGIFTMFGLSLGRLFSLGIIGAIGIASVAAFLGDPTAIITERFAGAGNTRGELWEMSFRIFVDSPIVGEMPFLQAGQEPNGIESTFIRVLANMGLLGAVVFAVPIIFLLPYISHALRLRRSGGQAKTLAALFMGLVVAQLVFNVFDGYAYGFLTFPVIFLHVTFTLGQFLSEITEADAEPNGNRLAAA